MESTLKVPLSFMAFSKIIPVNVSWIFLEFPQNVILKLT